MKGMILCVCFLMSAAALHAGQTGIVIEKVHSPSAPEKIGIRPGDTFTSWELLPAPSLHQGAEGNFETAFHWDAFLIEQVPRGTVKLYGKRDEKALAFEVPPGDWEGVAVRPVMPPEVLTRYTRGKALVREDNQDQGVQAWNTGLEEESLQGKADLACWFHLKIAKARAKQKAWGPAFKAFEKAKQYADGPLAQIAVRTAVALARKQQNELVLAGETYGELADLWKSLRGEGLGFAQSQVRVGDLARKQGKPAVAQQILEHARSIQEKQAPGSLSLADSLNNLGSVAGTRGDFESASDYFRRALAIVEEQAPGSLSLASSLNGLGSAAWSRGDLESASDYYKRALAIREKQAPGSLELAGSLGNLGIVAARRGDFESASDYFRRALAIREKQAPGSLELAGNLNNLGLLAGNRGDLESSSDYHKRALAIWEKQAPGSLFLAHSLNNLGSVAHYRGDLESASDYYKRTLAIQEKQAPGSLHMATILSNLGSVARDRGELESASDYYERALAIVEKQAPGSLSLATNLKNLGVVARNRGDLESASDYNKRALAIEENQAPGSLSLGISLTNLGNVAADRGDLESASDYHKRGLAITEKQAPGSLSLAVGFHNLGTVAHYRGDLESASDYYKRALAIMEKQAPGSLSLANSLNGLGVLARRRGDLESASDYYKRALAGMEKQAPGSLSLAAGLHNLGNVAVDRGDLESASDYYKRALAIQEKQAPGSEAEAESHYQLARTLPKSNRVNQALTHFEQAITNLESQLGRLGGSDQDKTRFQGQKASYYRSYIDFLISQKEPEQAFAILERARARVLHQMISERDLVLSGPEIPSELEKKRKRAAFRYEKTQQALAEAYSDEARAEALRAELRNRRRDHDAVIEDIRKASPGLANLHAPKPLDLAGIQKELDVGTVLLSYSVHEEQIVLFVVVKSQALEVHNIDKGEAWLREKVGDLTSFIKNKDLKSAADFFDESSRELYQLLIEPAAKAVAKADRLLIIPDGPLSVLPFGALISGEKNGRNRYLIQDKPILTAVSATIFFEQKALPTNGTDRLTAFGDPVYPREESEGGFSKWLGEMKAKVDFRSRGIIETRGRSLAPLPGTREEVNTIARLYGNKAETLLGEEATEERAKQLSDDPGIVHFACHGLIDKRSPLDSSLALTTNTNFQEGEDNGFLQAWEIFESVRLNTDLLVLSACDTGLGKEEGTEGLVGLTRAFQFAGARTIAASYWKIADDTTALFMKRFYTHLKSGMRKDEAMRKAQIEFIEGTVSLKKSGWFSKKGPDISRPYYWAAFQLHGPGD